MNSESPEGPHERLVGRLRAREQLWGFAAARRTRELLDEAADELDRLRAERDALRVALAAIERRLREETGPILDLIAAHGNTEAHRAWKSAIYASAIHAQLALTPNAVLSGCARATAWLNEACPAQSA